MEEGVCYHAYYFDPRTGRQYEVGIAVGDEKGEWTPPNTPIHQDFVLVMENNANQPKPKSI